MSMQAIADVKTMAQAAQMRVQADAQRRAQIQAQAQSAAQALAQTPAQSLGPDGTQKAGAISPRQAKLIEAAQKFEGMMMEELLKPMQKAGDVGGSGFGGEDDDSQRDSSLDTFSSYGVEAMAEALSKGGGLGLAKQVLRQIGNVDEKDREVSSSTKV